MSEDILNTGYMSPACFRIYTSYTLLNRKNIFVVLGHTSLDMYALRSSANI